MASENSKGGSSSTGSSSSNNNKNEKMKLAPFRSLNDFLLDPKKYQVPPFSDLGRLNNRITSNLLYYQTNYFALSASVFLLFLLFCFRRVLGGILGITTTAATILFVLNMIPQTSDLRSKYPFAVYVAGAVNLMIVYSAFRSILFILLVALVPTLVWVAHASSRSRGLINKVSNKVDQLSGRVYSNTPMGCLLMHLGYEARDYDE